MTQGAPSQEPKFAVDLSRGFSAWLATQKASIAITTYQVGKVIFFGVDKDGQFWSYNRTIGRCLGMAVGTDRETGRASEMWVSSDAQLYRYADILDAGREGPKGADLYLAPRMSYVTGDIDMHDLGIDADGRPIFANTLFNCLARPDPDHSFQPVWKPDFISTLLPEDRCHLNGLAMRDGKPAFVTAVSQSDTFDGWRGHRRDGGVVIEIESGKVVCEGLSMPHSPRWHDGRLWLHNSGEGQFGYVDMEKGAFVPVAFCPGYLRGLAFMGDIAVVGMSLPRDNKTFSGLKLDEELAERKMSPRAGLYFIDTTNGSIVHSMNFEGIVTELYDVCVLPGIRQPAAIGPASEEIRRTIKVADFEG
ncbi:TIGR03032 family protein [Erythrobacter sp. YJ-T3-07]|uniref:TIGR03032 family protein n=1 Tax=Erythrobacter sp. YJ-T3-07 TaxID=2793063 RepID=UPI0018D29AA2|nr:TIGR03032 family protein [Erythrobacter sp. YJ-T3-07]MBH1943856.1 TIGR03032 family protein [Erythrobacter sp. YJ-T3-07]